MAISVAEIQARISVDDSELSKLDSAGQRVDSFASKTDSAASRSLQFGAASAAMAAGAVGIGVGIADAVMAAGDFEAAMNGIQSVTGATVSEMDALSAMALKVGQDTSFSAQEGADAISELGKAGIPIPDILNGAAMATAALAAAGGVDMPRAAEVMSNAMNVFKISGSDAADVADILAGAANTSASDINSLAMGMAQAGPAAAGLGLSLEETVAQLALFADRGMQGSDAGTSLKTMLASLTPKTDPARQAFADLGLAVGESGNAFFDAQGNFIGMAEANQVLYEALAPLTDLQRQQALETIFGSDASRAAELSFQAQKAAVEGTGRGYTDYLAAVQASGQATEVAEAKMAGMNGALEALRGSIETAQIAFGMAFLPAVEMVAEGLTSLVNAFIALPAPVQNVISFATAGAAAFLAVGSAIGFMIGPLGALVGALAPAAAGIAAILGPLALLSAALYLAYSTNFLGFADGVHLVIDATQQLVSAFQNLMSQGFDPVTSALAALKHVFPQLAPQLETLYAGWRNLKKGVEDLTQAFQGFIQGGADPLHAALGALGTIFPQIGGLIDTAIALWLNFKETLAGVGQGLMDALLALSQGDIGGVLQGLFDAAMASIQGFLKSLGIIGQGIVQAFTSINWQGVSDTLMTGLQNASTALQTWFNQMGANMTTWMSSIDWSGVALGIVQGIGNALAAVGDAAGQIAQKLGDLGLAISTWVQNAVPAVVAAFQGLWTSITSGGGEGGSVVDSLITALGPLGERLSQWVTEAAAALTPAWDSIKSGVTGALQGMSDEVSTVMQTITTTITEAWPTIQQAVSSAMTAIQEVVSSGWVTIQNDVATRIQGVQDAVTTAWEAIQTLVSEKMTAISEAVSTGWDAIQSAVTEAQATIQTAIETGWSTIQEAVSAAQAAIGENITNVWTAISDFLGTAVSGMLEVVTTGFESIKTAITTAAEEAKSGFITTLQAMASEAASAVGAVKDAVVGAFADAGSWLISAGQSVGQGFIDGLGSMVGAVGNAAGNLASAASSTVTSNLGIRSPSTVFRGFGIETAEGFADGIRSGEGTVAAAVIALVESITGTVRDRLASVSDLFADTGKQSGRKLKEGLDATTADPTDYTVGSDEWHAALREKIDASMGDIGRSGGKKLKDGVKEGVGSIEESLGALVDINSTLQPVLDAWTTIDTAIVDAGASSSETAQALGLMAENLRSVGMGNKEITYLADQFDVLAADIHNAGGTMESEMLDRVGRLGKELPIALDAAGLAFGRFGQMSSDEVLKSMAQMLDGITSILRDLVSAVREAFGLAASAGTDQFSENVWDGLTKGMDGGTEIIGSKGDDWQDALITVGERAGQTLGEAMAEGISQKEIDWLSSIGGIVDRGVKRATEDGKKGVTAGEMVVQEMTRGTRRKEAEYLRRMTEIVDAGVQQGVQDAAKGADVGAAFSTNVAEGMNDGLTDVERAAQGMSDEAITALRSRARMMVEIGLDYSVGFAQGMLDGADQVREAASEVGRQAERELRRATESASPSKAAMRVGQDVGEGFAQGIESGEGRVKQAARKLWKAALREVLAGSGPARFLGEDWAAEFWAGMLNSPDMTGPLAAWITDQMVAAASTALGKIKAEISGLAAQLDIARRTVGTTSIPEVPQPEPVDTAQRDLLQDQLDATRELTAALEKAFTSAFDAAHKAHVAFVKGQISQSEYAAKYQTAVQAYAAKQQSKAQETALEQQISALTAAIEAETAARQKAYDEQVAAREQAVAAELAAQQAAVAALEQQYFAAQQAMTQAVIEESTRRIAELQREASKARDPQERAEIKAMIALEQERINVATQLGQALDAAASASSAFDLSVANAQVEFLTAQLEALGQVDVGSLLQAAADSISAAAEKMAGAADKIKKALGGGGKDAEGGGGGSGFDEIKRGADGASAAIDRTSGAADRFEIAGGRMAAAGRLAGNEIGRGIGEGAGVAERAIDELVRNGTINLERGMLEAGRKGGKSMTDGAATAIADGQVHMIKRVETSWEAATINGEKVAGEGGRKMVSEMTRSIDGELVTRTREVSRGTEQMMQTASQDATKVAQKGGKDVGSDFSRFTSQAIDQGSGDVRRAGKDIMDGAGKEAQRDANRLGKQAGDDLGRGVADGIRQRQNDVASAARQIIQAANQAARQAAQSNSPSRLFRDLGHDLVDGLTLGIYERRKDAAKEMAGLVPSAVGSPTSGGGVTTARANGRAGETVVVKEYHFHGDIRVPNARVFEEIVERKTRMNSVAAGRGT